MNDNSEIPNIENKAYKQDPGKRKQYKCPFSKEKEVHFYLEDNVKNGNNIEKINLESFIRELNPVWKPTSISPSSQFGGA